MCERDSDMLLSDGTNYRNDLVTKEDMPEDVVIV